MNSSIQERYEPLESLEDFWVAKAPMWIFDQRTLAFLEVNAAAIDSYDYSRQQFLGMTILDIRPPDEITKLVRSALCPHPADGTVWKHRRRDGSIFVVKIFSREILFQGRLAELVTAQPLEKPAYSEAAPSTAAETTRTGQASAALESSWVRKLLDGVITRDRQDSGAFGSPCLDILRFSDSFR